jgi:peptidoglycan/LPS O-acetylase OafA/YrhL
VMLSHVSEFTAGPLDAVSSYGVQAVDIFFVLSGYVIAYVTATREGNSLDYMISRLSRIYSVALPALIVTVILDQIGTRIDPSVYADSNQGMGLGPIVRSLLFMNELWNTHRFPGSNSPWWSLGFEVWYYIIFGAYMFAPKVGRVWICLGLIIIAGPKILIMMPIWLMGVATYNLSKGIRLNLALSLALALMPFALVIVYEFHPISNYDQVFIAFDLTRVRLASYIQDYLIGFLFSLHLIGFASLANGDFFSLGTSERMVRWLAGAAFSLYLFHLPVLRLIMALAPFGRSTIALSFCAPFLTFLCCLALAEISERRKELWRSIVRSGFDFAGRFKNLLRFARV